MYITNFRPDRWSFETVPSNGSAAAPRGGQWAFKMPIGLKYAITYLN